MAIEKPTWTYKSKGDKQTASEMNELAQAVITNAIELSNTKDDIANLSDDITNFDNRITSIEDSETVKKEERNQPNGYAGLDSSGKIPIERIYGATAAVTDVAAYELLPATGSNGVIYNVLNTGAQYKWSGSAYIDITDGADNAKKNETSIFDCSNGTSTKYYTSLSEAINVVPPAYRTSNRIISYLSTENSTTSAVNYQYHGIDSITWTNLTKWERVPNQADLVEIRSDLNEIEINKLDRSSLSSLLDLDSENNAATSRAIKLLNDKVEQVKDGGLEDGSIELPKLSPTLAAYIGSGGEVTNQADDEDLENAIINDVPVIREKTNKAYTPETYSGMGRVILRKNMAEGANVLTQSMVNQANTIYEIRYDFDLNGADIQIKDGCVLNFVGGSLSNGTINSSKILFSGNYPGNIKVTLNCNNITNNFCIISSDNNIKNKIETSSNNIILNGDIKLETPTKLGTNLYSNNHIITVGVESYIYIYKQDNISINGVIFKKELPPQTVPNYENKRYILYIDTFQHNINISNCTFNNGCFAFKHIEKSDTTYGNLKFENNTVNVDYKSWENQEFVERDLFSIRGISNVMIKNNIIHCENIERVFKISSITDDENYQLQYNIPKNIIIENNIIHSDGYKQVLDGFVGSQSVSLSKNQLIIKNHTNIFEQKSTYQNIPAYLKMNDNYIITNSHLVYVDATSSSLMEMKNNIIKFEDVVNNIVYDFINIRGTNTIIQNNVFSHINDETTAAFLQVGVSSVNNNAPKKIIIKDNDFGEIKGEHILYGKWITYSGNNVKNARLGSLFECEMLDFTFNNYQSSVYPIRLYHYYFEAPKLTPIMFNIDNISYEENVRLIQNDTDYIDTNYILEICNNPNIFISDIQNKQIQIRNYKNFGHTIFDNKIFKTGSIEFNAITKKPITRINDKCIDMNGNIYNSLTIGSTQERPTDIRAGFYYFDTTLNKPVWKKDNVSSVWVDANGVEA